ncbi:predicted protein [Botrytis cinerea T4]|uniref:Uncharacterized protein n=1 Tax=Botryotinia fuckeliana (strain T4) TaxID=999810 RepID=G2Y1Y5_BOTF4|nr:predicted protein [Botrytis cinerea T4]
MSRYHARVHMSADFGTVVPNFGLNFRSDGSLGYPPLVSPGRGWLKGNQVPK